MGLPVSRFIAATNFNDVVPEYLKNGAYRPLPSIPTISNAMDVVAPSNFARMACLFGHDADTFRKMISGYSFSDEVTRECIRSVYEESGYIMDPHGAVAFCGLRSYMQESESRELNGVRSEEHTSELQSLMRISYAVFCLKKKKNTISTQHT